MNNYKNMDGYIALTSLLIISAVTLAISVSITLITLTEAQSSFTFTQGMLALKMAEGCGEEALIRLRNSPTYAGGALMIDQTSCTIALSGSNPYNINVIATENSNPVHKKKLQIIALKGGNTVNIISWQFIE